MSKLGEQIIIEGNKWVGVREDPKNDGPEIREWLRRVGVIRPAPYCAAWAWCILDDACKALEKVNLIDPTASSHQLLRNAKAIGLWSASPVAGAIGGIDHGTANGVRIGHIVIVVEEHEDGHLLTLEANTNAAGSREGDRVMLKGKRTVKDCTLGFLIPW
jgi:hypothetical protein